jgi:hypothetical protein
LDQAVIKNGTDIADYIAQYEFGNLLTLYFSLKQDEVETEANL